MKKSVDDRARLEDSYLAASLVLRAREAGARAVLITSPEQGDGKSTLADLLRREFAGADGGPCCVLTSAQLRELESTADTMTWIDGPSLLDPPGVISLPSSVRAQIDGAVLVVRANATETESAKLALQRLRELALPCLGVVWNEVAHSRPAHGRATLRSGLFRVGLFARGAAQPRISGRP